ncbi:MAG: succinate dehydrogenase, hydrophobic membrane anchor protein [Gammaproteobacteria bacterium]|jgi:succinate dehydrogenase / fumarate reductase membrane anchor subunit|nr:succinate dehydrogenase, hydrophobic membrane anchor protein [Chromatiales bacterium]MDP6675347.1 succinate dehydrogenase, hydrophobic membrane anchor protein [Gammaproteobacteria bacterium]
MSLQSPLAKALGHGSSKAGPEHWLVQRSTAIALAPLGLWFIYAMVTLEHGSYEIVTAWVAEPMNAILLILLVMVYAYHSMLGLQVIIEDYVRGGLGYLTLLACQFIHLMLATAGIYAVIVTALGAGQ